MGFNITASDIEIHVSPTKLDNVKTRIDIPLLLAKNVKISNRGLINLSYNEVDLGSVYGVYEKNSDKIRVHRQLLLQQNMFNNSSGLSDDTNAVIHK